MQVTLYNYSGRVNDFGKSKTALETVNAVLKDDTSVTNPTLILTDFYSNANYAYIPKFNRYYFINNITAQTNKTFAYALSVDVLDSYYGAINNYRCYIERASNHPAKDNSDYLFDETLTHAENENAKSSYSAAYSLGLNTTGFYVLRTAGTGGVTSYCVSPGTLDNIVKQLFNSDFYADGIVDDTVKTYFNPFQYIISCKWFPLSAPSTSGTAITFGWWQSGYSGGIAPTSYTLTKDIKLPGPGSSDSKNFTFYDPSWTRINLYIPGAGTVEIDPINSNTTISVRMDIDFLTGNSTTYIYDENEALISTVQGQLGIDVQLTQLSTDISNLGTNIFGGIEAITGANQSASQGGLLAMATTGFATGAGSLVDVLPGVNILESKKRALSPELSIASSNGNRSNLINHPNLIVTYRRYFVYDTYYNLYGKPYHVVDTISNCSGFIKCRAVYLMPSGATAKEIAAIKNTLEGGIYK